MRSRRLGALLVLVFTGLIIGGFSQQAAIITIVIPLLGFITASLLYQPGMLDITVDRDLTKNLVNEQAAIQVNLTITNHGDKLEEVHIRDHVPDGLEITEGVPYRVTQLAPDECISWTYTVTGSRGQYRFGTVEFTAYEPFGLLRRSLKVQSNRQVEVLPTLQRIDRISIRPQRTRGFAGPIPSGQAGSGTAFYGLREYQTGDPLRWINWRVSARRPGSLFSNQYEQERIADVGIILDARLRNEIHIAEQSLFEQSVKAAGTVANAFLDDGHRVALLVYGRGLEWVTPGYGKLQRQRLMRQLAKAKIGDSQAFDHLDYLPTQMFPAQSQIVLVSPLNKTDVNMLSRMRARGYSVLVISPNPVSFELLMSDAVNDDETAIRLAQMERALLLKQVERSGAVVVDWDIRDNLNSIMRTAVLRHRSGHL